MSEIVRHINPKRCGILKDIADSDRQESQQFGTLLDTCYRPTKITNN